MACHASYMSIEQHGMTRQLVMVNKYLKFSLQLYYFASFSYKYIFIISEIISWKRLLASNTVAKKVEVRFAVKFQFLRFQKVVPASNKEENCALPFISLFFPLSNSLTCHFQVKPNLFFLSPSLYTSFIKMAGNTQKCLSVCYFAKWRFANGDTWVPLKTKVFISFLHTHNFNIHPFDSPNLPFLPTSHCSNKKLLGTTYTSFFCVKKNKKTDPK